jgi:precorrin-6B methylase 2
VDSQQKSLVELGIILRSSGYRFVTPPPLTHEIVNSRPENEQARSLTGVFGWSRSFAPDVVGGAMIDLMEAAGVVEPDGILLRSTVRFSTLGPLLVVHSAYPTADTDSVFFGPDTYRTCRAMRAELAADRAFVPRRIVDVGAGSGAIGLYASTLLPYTPRVLLTDISPHALWMAEVNARLNGVPSAEIRRSDILDSVSGPIDLIVSNPPFMVDRSDRLYRNGGGDWGMDLSCQVLAQSLAALDRGGRLMLFTGTPIVDGKDIFAGMIEDLIDRKVWSVSYAEVDPNIYPEELFQEPYSKADRIAAVFLVAAAGNLATAQ